MTVGYIGKFNDIYFITEQGNIIEITDRARRKDNVMFRESLEDLLTPPRDKSNLTAGGPGSLTDSIEVEEIQHEVLSSYYESPMNGFGRTITYHSLKTSNSPNASSVVLQVKLPSSCRFTVEMDVLSRSKDTFLLSNQIQVTIISDRNWDVRNNKLEIVTDDLGSEVTFFIHSYPFEINAYQNVIIAKEGHEKSALLTRAVFGADFVQCFVVDDYSEITRFITNYLPNSVEIIVFVGFGNIDNTLISFAKNSFIDPCLDSSVEFSELIKKSKNNILHLPDNFEAYGPALFLAIENEADMVFDDYSDTKLILKNRKKQIVKTWDLEEVIGEWLYSNSDKTTHFRSPDDQEVIVCENTLEALLVSQAIGYAFLQNSPIGFIPKIDLKLPPFGFSDAETGISFLTESATNAVPEKLRVPKCKIITVFTSELPLHLVKVSDTLNWMDEYVVAHLPNQLASMLIPRFLKSISLSAPPVSFSVILDALSEETNTEGELYAKYLEEGLSYPILLHSDAAKEDVLKVILEQFHTDLVLLIAHGQNDYLVDVQGNHISATEIESWSLRSQPIIFNNSCTSWTTSSQAFLKAGAMGVISTLWPVSNYIASKIASYIGQDLKVANQSNMAFSLQNAIRNTVYGKPKARQTAAAYIYIGLPIGNLLTTPLINRDEKISLLSNVLNDLYMFMDDIAIQGRPDLAVAIQNVTGEAIHQHFISLLEPGKVAPILPGFAPASILDINFVMATKNFDFGKSLISRLPHEHWGNIINLMENYLIAAINELVHWETRHDDHLGRSPQIRKKIEEVSPLPIAAIGEGTYVELAAKFTHSTLLPFLLNLVEIKLHDKVYELIHLAKLLLTQPVDLDDQGDVTDDALIHRIKEGIVERYNSIRISSKKSDIETGRDSLDLIEKGESEIIELDLLARAINKSDLLNRFGVVYFKIGDLEKAAKFYLAAQELALPGSGDFANVTSNLANIQREQGKFELALENYKKALSIQLDLGDYRNSTITTANMLRLATDTKKQIEQKIIDQSLNAVKDIFNTSEQIQRHCDILGALSCYYASRYEYNKANLVCNEIENYVRQRFPSPQAATSLNELALWFYARHLYEKGLEQATRNASILIDVGLFDVAVRTYVLAGECALEAYSRTGNNKYINAFCEASQKVAEILTRYPTLKQILAHIIEGMWQNTVSIWKQSPQTDDISLSAKFYSVVKIWDSKWINDDWENLSKSLNPLSREHVEFLAKNHSLERRGIIVIEKRQGLKVIVTRVTRRIDNISNPNNSYSYPEATYHIQPIYKQSQAKNTGKKHVAFVGNSAVYTLSDGESVKFEQVYPDGLRTDGKGTYLYDETWGSKFIPYSVSIKLHDGLIPLDIQLKLNNSSLSPSLGTGINLDKLGHKPSVWIEFTDEGCEMTIEQQNTDTKHLEPWLAEINLVFRSIPALGFVLTNSNSPFKNRMDFNAYLLMLQIFLNK